MAGIDRRKVNKQSVSAADPVKSGFDLSYTSYNDYSLGLAHVSGVHWQMPGSKFSGHNKGNFTFNNVSTPMVSPIDGTQFNIVVSLRSIDNSFEDAFAPSKNNDMSNSWRVPTWTLGGLAAEIFDTLGIFDGDGAWRTSGLQAVFTASASDTATTSMKGALSSLASVIASSSANPEAVARYTKFNQHYLSDFLYDWQQYAYARLNPSALSGTLTAANLRSLAYDAFLTPIMGEGSLIDELGFIKLRRFDISKVSMAALTDRASFIALFDDAPQSEYPLRAYYAAWYELMREPNLEPVAPTLPKWKHFGTNPVCTLPFFVHRYRAWYDDPYTTSQPDDMSRHVYAPIFENSSLGTEAVSDGTDISYPSADFDYENAEGNAGNLTNQRNIVSQKLTWRDSLTGAQKFIQCPIPALVNDSLRSSSSTDTTLGLDLFNLRQAQSLERYLKRNFYFGDEYKDRMLAHYGSNVSDNRLNRPLLLSTSINAKDEEQEIANVSTDQSTVGDRNATMTITTSGDGYEYFAEEFCIVFNMIAFMPRPQYAGVLPHNLLFRQADFPIPEFAANNEELSRVSEIAVSGLAKSDWQKVTFGHHPYAHIWRGRVDEVHGSFISARRDYTFARFFGADERDTMPKLNYFFVHCRPSLGMFRDQIRLEGQLYGSVVHEFYSECPLPVPVENI